jgi:AcrR family transcriptional regulator
MPREWTGKRSEKDVSMSKRAARQASGARAEVRLRRGFGGQAVRKHVPQAQRREQIFDAAAELFSQRGFAGTTTRQIAAVVGTSETVLFRHFPSKESLYAAILEHRLHSVRRKVSAYSLPTETFHGPVPPPAHWSALVDPDHHLCGVGRR